MDIETICVCPNSACETGLIAPDRMSSTWEECPRCGGYGYIECADIQEEENYLTVAEQRAGFALITHPDGTITREKV